jgi:hypothetical protein
MSQLKIVTRTLVLSLLFSVYSFSSFAQTSASYQGPPRYSYGPITDYEAALPTPSGVLRFRRGERYNLTNPSVPEIGEQSEPKIVNLAPSHFRRNPMPFEHSNVVAVGTIKAGQAFLSNDKRDIYTEFSFSVEEVLKTPAAPYVRVGDSIDIERRGGVVKLPSGKIIVRGTLTDSMPLVGKRYLLFLRFNPNTEDYHLQTGYQIEGGHAYRLDDQSYEESNHESEQHSLREEALSADQVLSRVRSKAAASPHGGQQRTQLGAVCLSSLFSAACSSSLRPFGR